MRKILCENCAIRDTGIIADLPIEKIDEFRSHSVTAIYKTRQVIFHEGTPASGLYIVCHGAVKLYQSDRFGRDHILAVAGAGDLLGELPVDPTESYSTSAEALTESQLCYLPRERLEEFIQFHPMTGVRLIAALSTALSAARKKARDLALKSAETRLAELLVYIARGAGQPMPDKETRIRLGYSRREIAEMIGVSTETAIRLLGRLKKKRVITACLRDLVIADVEKLARFAAQGNIGSL
jgi:CRP-like cAMP-binding protein